MVKKHNIIYKITNIVNNKIYIGCHQTDDLEDNYMGSGKLLQNAYKKYGVDKFIKETLYDFETLEDMFIMEKYIVNEEFIKREDNYNITVGGCGGFTHLRGSVTVKDSEGNTFRTNINDPRYISGELRSISANTINVRDINEKIIKISIFDPRYISGELRPVLCMKNKVVVRDKNNNMFIVDINDPRYISGELKVIACGKVTVKDSEGNTFRTNINDPRYISGELHPIWKGKKHKEDTKIKIGKANSIKQKGKGNSQYGKCWIFSLDLKISKSIKKKDLVFYLNQGWQKGRKINF